MNKNNFSEQGVIITLSRENLYDLVSSAVKEVVTSSAVKSHGQQEKTKLNGFRNASKAVGVGINKLLELRDKKLIRFYRIGSNYFFYKEELLEDLENLSNGGQNEN